VWCGMVCGGGGGGGVCVCVCVWCGGGSGGGGGVVVMCVWCVWWWCGMVCVCRAKFQNANDIHEV
jgi:hypothetical protein